MDEPTNQRYLTTRVLLAVAALALTLLLAACGGGPNTPASGSFGGDWQGSWTSNRGVGGPLSASFDQDGDKITGEVSLSGSPCLTSGTITGTISGSGATFGALSGSDQITFTGNKEGESTLTGTYLVGAGECIGDAGTFQVVRSR